MRFTGAHASQPGKFEQANGGTLLLDEVSEMPLALQAKLLRVLQEREVDRLGGRHTIALDVRVLATTNRDLRAEVSGGRFREDLYYRLSVFPLQWLPLRQRRDDIVAIANKLLQQHAAKMGRGAVRFDSEALRVLRDGAWPGNVRELDNVVQRALIMQQGSVLSVSDLCLDPFHVPALAAMPLTPRKRADSATICSATNSKSSSIPCASPAVVAKPRPSGLALVRARCATSWRACARSVSRRKACSPIFKARWKK